MRRIILWLLLVAAASLSCRSPHIVGSSTDAAEETIALSPGPVDPPPRTYIGHIANTNLVNANLTIKVFVGGTLNPGEITLPKGTTVLGAIRRGGGFREGDGGEVRLIRSGHTYLLRLCRKPLALSGHYRIAYGDEKVCSDFRLEDGDRVVVPRVL